MTDITRLFAASGDLFLIAGPCVLEDDELNLCVARELVRLRDLLGVPIIFKASFDKANRSKAGAARGPGLHHGLQQLALVRAETSLPVLTDVHEPEQARAAGEICDVLQIPAFLSRQTDLVEAAARTGRALNIKKGQWMGPADMRGAVDKARNAGAPAVAVTERGTFFGYGDLVVDMRNLSRLRAATEAAVIFDGTHSVQQPGKADGASGGTPEFTPLLVRAAVAAGVDGLFLEVHPRPQEALSDGSNMMPLAELEPLLMQVLSIREAIS